MKKMIITVMAALFMFACGEKKTIDPAQVEAMKAIVSGTPAKTEAHSPAATNVSMSPAIVNEPTVKPADEIPELRYIDEDVIGFSERMMLSQANGFAHMIRIEPGDIYFTIVLDDGVHYICTTMQEVLAIAALMDYSGRSGEMVTSGDVGDYVEGIIYRGESAYGISQDKWDKSLRALTKSLGYRAYDVYGEYNQYRNWESKGI